MAEGTKTWDETRGDAVKNALSETWAPVEDLEAARDAGRERSAAGDAAVRAMPDGDVGAKSAWLAASKKLLPELWADTDDGYPDTHAIRRLEQAGVVSLNPDFARRLAEYETQMDQLGTATNERYAGQADTAAAEKALPAATQKATLTEAGGDPLKSQLPTE